MIIQQIPLFQDNYSYLLVDEATNTAAVVDPADPEVVLRALSELNVDLVAILCTHHHWDHSGGNLTIQQKFPKIAIYGGKEDAARIPGLTVAVDHGATVAVGEITGCVLSVPCHTRGHIAYLFNDALFCGDTLFVGGCGRFFEGDAQQMDYALNSVFGTLADDVRVFCGHEYTVNNLRFAQLVEPFNRDVKKKLEWAVQRRQFGESTVPSTLAEERTYNPFFRTRHSDVQAFAGCSDPVEVLRVLRERKDTFR